MIDRMMDRRGFDNFDLRFFGLIFAILSIGVLSIYSVTHDQGGPGVPFFAKQMVWILLGALAFLIMLVWDYHRIARLAYPAYAIILILLAVVLFEGKTSRGAQRWIPIGPFAFQPSEFAKLVLILVMAHYYSKAPRVGWLQRVVIPGALMLPGLLLILKQPDLGSGLSFLAVYAAMLLMVGMRSQALGVILLFSLMLFPFAWEVMWGSLHDYQRQRIMAFVDPNYDPGGKGYHALQSRIAIGAGGAKISLDNLRIAVSPLCTNQANTRFGREIDTSRGISGRRLMISGLLCLPQAMINMLHLKPVLTII